MSNFIPTPGFVDELIRGSEFQAHLQGIADEGLAVAERLVPYDPDEPDEHILDTLHVEDGPDGGKRVVAGTDHWQFVEFGTSEMEAQPFLRPIIDELGLNR